MLIVDLIHPGMVIAHVDEDRQLFVTWNGSATFRVFLDHGGEITETDCFTRYEVNSIDAARAAADEWMAAQDSAQDGA